MHTLKDERTNRRIDRHTHRKTDKTGKTDKTDKQLDILMHRQAHIRQANCTSQLHNTAYETTVDTWTEEGV